MNTPLSEINRAFNLGSDARIHGLPLTANPFESRKALGDTYLWQMWVNGWRHVNSSWNVDNQYYPVGNLPPVRHTPSI